MKIAWLTDIHLNFLNDVQFKLFCTDIMACNAEHILITGDIAESDDFLSYIADIEEFTKLGVSFVLGNHDYYGGSIEGIRKSLEESITGNYLANSIVVLGDTALIGQDGFADGRCGDYAASNVVLNDHIHIQEFAQAHYSNRPKILELMQVYADHDAETMKDQLFEAIKDGAKKIIIATHVPPFPEVAVYRGQPTDDAHLPFYVSQIMGDVIKNFALSYPDIKFLVLCGHTHSKQYYKALPNLEVYCGGAEYNHPKVQGIIDSETLEVEWL